MRKQKVLHVLPTNSFSGAENVACTIIENDKEYDMYYCCPNGPIEKILKEKKIKYIPLKKFSPRSIKKVCKENDIDILHAHDYKASFCAALSGFKGKIISHIHANWDFSRKWTLYSVIYNMLIKKFYRVIVVSDEIYNDSIFVKKHEDKFRVVTNVVDKKSVLDNSKKLKTDKYDIIYLGRLCDVKNPQVVIEVTKKLAEKNSKIKTAIIGKGDLEEECNSLIKKYNIENNIEMLGFKSNPFPYVKNSKVAMLPSKHEGLPMSVIECMILNVPVLNSGVDGLKSFFAGYEDFFCKSVDDYCDKIEQILDGNEYYSKSCKEIISDAVDIKNYINKINSVYE